MNKFKQLKNHVVFKLLTNIFVVILIPFIIWMLFFDENSYIVHRKFDEEIKELENSITYYKERIKKDKETIKKLQDSLELERFAREKYLMKKENEDLFIIEFDTIKN
ncbi:MAG: septum formation initiator family protein [Flavobacteriaceae bacterium]|nr:septum formation initiator family protein [Flavobacteriaceae bacterium]